MEASLWDQWRALVVPNMGLIEIGLTFFLVIGFCVHQYFKMDREIKKDRAEREAREAAEKESVSED